MHYCVTLGSPKNKGTDMKLATWNVNSLKMRIGHVCDWLKATQTDILCLQELKLVDELFPNEALNAIGYRAI